MVSEDANTDQSPEPPDPWLGKVVDGRYRVLERIGQGGMGVVYKIEHATIGKIAAMKLLHANFVADRELLQRFQAEAEAISKLSHPNIVQVFDFGRESASAYIIMEYLKGEDLGLILRRDGNLQLPRCVSIVAQICDALTEAHDLGIIHRDLKPENIRVSRTKDGQDFVKVLDFGLAKMVATEEQAAITAQGSLVGTPYYMAPEQIRAEEIDHRCDIYSLGALLYHMLTGHNAFAAKTPMGVLTKHITEELRPPSSSNDEISVEVDSVVLRAMAKVPTDRYDSAQSLKQALVSLLWNSGEVPALPNAAELPLPDTARRTSDAKPDDAKPDDNGAVDIAFLPTGTYNGSSIDRLQREDIAFERRLRRNKLFMLSLLLPFIAAAAFAAYWFGFRPEPIIAPSEEIEPNNELLQATLLASDKSVRGQIGQRVSATESDRDWYVLNVKRGTDALSAAVTGIPNMDVTLELYDALGGRLFTADCTGTGGPESIPRWPLSVGKYYLLVREMWRVGERPTENVTDSYRLVASWSRWEPGWELEPNDTEKQASVIAAGQNIRGLLGSLSDVDAFKITSKQATEIPGTISGVDGVDLVVRTISSAGTKRSFNAKGKGKGEAFTLSVEPHHPAYLLVQRRNHRKRDDSTVPAGLKIPYLLKLQRAAQ